MRAPGVVQTTYATEAVIERVAFELGLPMVTVQQNNFIRDGLTNILGQVITSCKLSTVWYDLMRRSRFDEKLARNEQYNSNNLWRKRGVSISPVKYGMGWDGYNAGVVLGICSTDGTVTVSHSGCEIGQGINTKVAQAVAYALGIDIALVRVTATETGRVVNGGVTGGSGTSEVTCQAAINACSKINTRIDAYRTTGDDYKVTTQATADWVSLLSSLPSDVSLNTEGWYSPTANPNGEAFQYFVYAACVTEIELDVLTGNIHVLSCDIVYDCGQSLNPAIDIGQIEGALVMGLGYFVTEKVDYSSTGLLNTVGTWEYKPPLLLDIPSVLNVTLLKNDYNIDGILGSKAVGEPPYVIANSIYFAMKMAISSARRDAGVGAFVQMEVPTTIGVRQTASLVNKSRFIMPY